MKLQAAHGAIDAVVAQARGKSRQIAGGAGGGKGGNTHWQRWRRQGDDRRRWHSIIALESMRGSRSRLGLVGHLKMQLRRQLRRRRQLRIRMSARMSGSISVSTRWGNWHCLFARGVAVATCAVAVAVAVAINYGCCCCGCRCCLCRTASSCEKCFHFAASPNWPSLAADAAAVAAAEAAAG